MSTQERLSEAPCPRCGQPTDAPGPCTACLEPITWHLHPTVWQHVIHGDYEAQIWWTGPGAELAWCIYALPFGLDQLDQGTGTDEADAKAQAEAALRRLAGTVAP